jgi:hypothetical protein
MKVKRSWMEETAHLADTSCRSCRVEKRHARTGRESMRETEEREGYTMGQACRKVKCSWMEETAHLADTSCRSCRTQRGYQYRVKDSIRKGVGAKLYDNFDWM